MPPAPTPAPADPWGTAVYRHSKGEAPQGTEADWIARFADATGATPISVAHPLIIKRVATFPEGHALAGTHSTIFYRRTTATTAEETFKRMGVLQNPQAYTAIQDARTFASVEIIGHYISQLGDLPSESGADLSSLRMENFNICFKERQTEKTLPPTARQ